MPSDDSLRAAVTTTTETTLRTAAGPADQATISALAHRIWPEHYGPIIGMAQVDYMLAQSYTTAALAAAEAAGTTFYLAEQAGHEVGYAALAPGDEADTRLLDKLYLAAETRGQGLGRRLLEHLITAARTSGARRLALRVNRHNAASIAFYQRMGFHIVDAHALDIGGGYVMDDYRMTMALSGRHSGHSQS